MARIAIDDRIISQARAMYIATDMTIPQVAHRFDMNEGVLYKYCREEGWSLFKSSPNILDYTEELMDEVSTSLKFYELVKQSMIKNFEIYEEVKDKKMALDMFYTSERRKLELMMVDSIKEK